MKTRTLKLTMFAVIPIAMLVCTSCSSEKKEGEHTTTSMYQAGVPGGMRVDTLKLTAKVTDINRAKREMTIQTPDGTRSTVVASPDVVNFDQIQVGDQVKATVTQELVVHLRQPGASSADGEAAVVALAPVGAKPGMVTAHTMEVTARVKAIDLQNHKATLEFPGGNTRVVAVRPDVDLTKAKIGQELVVRTTETVALSVEKP
jgi:hypothetical protein